MIETAEHEAKDEAKKVEKKAATAAKKSAAVKQAGTKKKIKKQAAADRVQAEQKTAADHAAPAIEDVPVKHCTARFPARVVLVIAALFCAGTMALWSNSKGAAVAIKSDALNDQQCGLCDNGERNECNAVQEASETTCPANTVLGVRDDMGPDDGMGELALKPSSLTTTRQRVHFSAVPPQELFLGAVAALPSPPPLYAFTSTASLKTAVKAFNANPVCPANTVLDVRNDTDHEDGISELSLKPSSFFAPPVHFAEGFERYATPTIRKPPPTPP